MRHILFFFLFYKILFANEIGFRELLDQTLLNSDFLKSKELDIDLKKEDIEKSKAMNKGVVELSEKIINTNSALNVFGMKLSQRDASFKDFGFGDFLNPKDPNNILNIKPNDLNNPSSITNYETTINYQVPLYTGNKISSAISASSYITQAQQYSFNRDKKDLTKELFSVYNRVAGSKYFIASLKKAKEAANEYLKISTDMQVAGLVTLTDVLEAQQRVLEVEAMLEDANNGYENGISYIKFLSKNKTLTGIKDFEYIDIKVKNIEVYKQNSLKNRDELKYFENIKNSAYEGIKIANSEFKPQIAGFATYGTNGDIPSFDTDKDFYTVGISIGYKIFDGGVNVANKEQALIKFKQSEHYLNHTKEAILLEVEKNYKTLNTKYAVIKQKQKSQELLYEILEKSKLMYKNGLINMTQLLLKETDYLKAQAEFIDAKYQLELSKFELLKSSGDIMEELK